MEKLTLSQIIVMILLIGIIVFPFAYASYRAVKVRRIVEESRRWNS